MAAPIVNSDEELYQLTGSWEAAAALRDAQYNALNQYNASQPAPTTGGLLSGNILAGASWNSLNPTLAAELTAATGQETSNYAVGGATTTDTLNQLNTYIDGGGTFDSNATVFLQTGGVDFLQGVDKATIKDNINQICKTLASQGVDVVLTGSPYAASINDVVTNNFDPKVDPLFNEIVRENKNVALVGTQGEILQNKKLLVDALHTNAEGTSIYNQSVIDAMSQFKNEVPSSTPQDIAQAQRTNTISLSPPVITQAATNPVIAQTLARAIPTARGTVIEGDDIEAQIAGVPQVVYETRVDPNNTANWQTFNPKTGEVIDSGTFAGGGSKGLLEASRPVLALAASVFGAPYLSSLIGGATGLTGSALAGATGATIAGGSTALTGGSAEDTLRAILLGGGGGFLGSELNSYLNTAGGAVLGDASDIAMQMADAGKTLTEIETTLTNSGFSADVVAESLKDAANVLAPKAINIPSTVSGATDAVNVVGQSATPSLSNVLSTIAATAPVAVSTPVTDIVNVAAPKTTDMTTQEVINLVESQIAANVGAPANVANVQVTGDRLATTQEIANAVIATVPNITTQQAQTIAEQVIASGKPVTNQEIVNAVAATIPTPTTTPTTLATQTITAPKPATVEEIVNAITAIIPTVTPAQAQTFAEQVITSNRPVTIQEAINAITATIPIAPDPRLTITADRPSSIVDAVTAATIPLIQPTTELTAPQVAAQTTTDPLRVAQLVLTTAGLLGAGTALSSGSTQYPIVPVPETFLTPTKPAVAPFTPLTPINFGDKNLLIGTQWEKFLDPNYGKVPEPIKYSQPSNLSYNDLMGILGSKQGMPSASSLSINDIISGIQNQYGQVPARSMG